MIIASFDVMMGGYNIYRCRYHVHKIIYLYTIIADIKCWYLICLCAPLIAIACSLYDNMSFNNFAMVGVLLRFITV